MEITDGTLNDKSFGASASEILQLRHTNSAAFPI